MKNSFIDISSNNWIYSNRLALSTILLQMIFNKNTLVRITEKIGIMYMINAQVKFEKAPILMQISFVTKKIQVYRKYNSDHIRQC